MTKDNIGAYEKLLNTLGMELDDPYWEREKGIKTKMRVKLAAKMLVIAWTLMKKREPFDPTYLKID